jgi:PKD repeat protein
MLIILIIFAAPASAAVLQADFTADPTSGNAPLVVLFTDKSVGNASVYMWDFGDGGTSRNKNPGYTYLEPGNYTVTLKITRGPYYSTASHIITVPGTDPATEPPMAHLTAVSKTGTAPFTVQFIDKSTGGPTAWMWYFGDGDGALSREQKRMLVLIRSLSRLIQQVQT